MATRHTKPQRTAAQFKKRGRPRKDGAEHSAAEECGGCTRKGEGKYGTTPWCGRPACREFIETMSGLYLTQG